MSDVLSDFENALRDSESATSIPSADRAELIRRFVDLHIALESLSQWEQYVDSRIYKSFVQDVRDHAGIIGKTVKAYAQSLEPTERLQSATIHAMFDVAADLHNLAPDLFSAKFIDFTDEDLRTVGSPGLSLRDDRDGVRQLISRARLAKYDPERFRRLFGGDYPVETRSDIAKSWTLWDFEHPEDPAMCAGAWSSISKTLEP